MKLRLSLLALLATGVIITGCTAPEDSAENDTNSTNSAAVEDNTDALDEVLSDELLFEDDYYDETEVVAEDVYGQDIDFIERYPESIRSYYESYDGDLSVTYQTEDDQEAVRTYFNDLLAADGWGLDGDATDYMDYSRDTTAGEEYVSVYFYPYPDQGITEYELYYEQPYDDSDDEF